MKRFLPFAIIALVLLAAVLLAWRLIGSQRPGAPKSETSGPTAPPGAQPPHLRGDPNAPVTLEEYGDFQCPPCGLLYPELKKIESEYGSRLRVIFRERPLMLMHANALTAARAAEAAGLQGRFWEMHDKLYENQKTWSDLADASPAFTDYARSLGLDVDRFTRDLGSAAVETRIFLDGARAHALGIEGTPTVYINDRPAPFPAFMTVDGLRPLINKALNGTGP
ncbi:MAG: thioredoxin domain-containing protein [Pyrinomonadaceae bacterium]